MQYKNLGTSQIQISTMIMGTWQAGKAMWSGIQDDHIQEALHKGFEAGITTFDTAEIYGNGYSERTLAKAFRDIRDKVIYASKVFCSHLQYNQVIESCHRSLKNLQTDYLDLYQIHWPSGTFATRQVAIAETMQALNFLKEKGKIRAIGVSNFSAAQLKEALNYGRIESVQPPFSLLWPHTAMELLPVCQEQKITLLAYSPLAQGLLTGKFAKKHGLVKGDNRIQNRLFKPPYIDRSLKVVDKLRPLAEKHQTTVGNLALAWVLSHPQTCAIVGTRNSQQILENLKALEITLSIEEVEQMRKWACVVTDHLEANTIMWSVD